MKRIKSDLNFENIQIDDDEIVFLKYYSRKRELILQVKHIVEFAKDGIYENYKFKLLTLIFKNIIKIENYYEIKKGEILSFHKSKKDNFFEFEIYLFNYQIEIKKEEKNPLRIKCNQLLIKEGG